MYQLPSNAWTSTSYRSKGMVDAINLQPIRRATSRSDIQLNYQIMSHVDIVYYSGTGRLVSRYKTLVLHFRFRPFIFCWILLCQTRFTRNLGLSPVLNFVIYIFIYSSYLKFRLSRNNFSVPNIQIHSNYVRYFEIIN